MPLVASSFKWVRPNRRLGRLGLLAMVVVTVAIQPQTAPAAVNLLPPDARGLRVARGFTVSLYADAQLADDIYAMAVNPRGQIVVTGRGYIRTLVDLNQDGVAETTIEFGQTTTGGMGLCFVGADLWFVGDGALWRMRDVDGDNRADGPAVRVFDLPFAEHGGHAVRRGPEGALYVMVGNETKLAGWRGPIGPTGNGPIEGGALLRVNPGLPGGTRIVAQGFRNAYDFDFNSEGDAFTYDSDAEADVLLPWYTPTRLFHIAPGGHHGWRLDGWTRGWARPDYSPDTVEILAPIGRGSPTGVICYRHRQFPEEFRDGLFALDWSFGRIYFADLRADGASYSTRPEVFLESTGSLGFAPTDAVVGTDGSLYVSTGGRGSRGGVYRIAYTADPLLAGIATNWLQLANSELEAVLDAPDPLEEWSRRIWLPMAARLSVAAFASAALDPQLSDARRNRAVEVMMDLEGSLPPNTALDCARANSASVRARTAWSLGVAPGANAATLLSGLARDNDAAVRCETLHALRNLAADLPPTTLQQALGINLIHPDRRVRQAAMLLATWLPDAAWASLIAQLGSLPVQARFGLITASFWRKPPAGVEARTIDLILAALKQSRTAELRLEGVRLLIAALGDIRLQSPSAEVFTGYEAAFPITDGALVSRIEQVIGPFFPSGSADLNTEVTRLLAMIQARGPELPMRFVSGISSQTDPATDFHLLAAVARLDATLSTNAVERTAQAIVALDRKLSTRANRPKQNWNLRLNELVRRLLERNPSLGPALVRQPELVRPGNVPLVALLPESQRAGCARLFFAAVQRTVGYPWTVELVNLLATLPASEVHPLFRRQLNNLALRDRLVLELAAKPAPEDRPAFVGALASPDPRVVQAAAGALLKLPRQPATAPATVVATLRALRRFTTRPEDRDTRLPLVWLINQLTGEKFEIREGETNLFEVYQPIFNRVGQRLPGTLSQVDTDDSESQAKWDQFLKGVPWNRGNVERGQALFQSRGCTGCHENPGAFGPDLAGVASRLAPRDLFNAILYPSREIAPQWRMETFHLRNGENITGRIAYESGEVLLVQTGIGTTARIDLEQIASREKSDLSFMPGGLLTGLTPQDFADLHAWLKSLRPSR